MVTRVCVVASIFIGILAAAACAGGGSDATSSGSSSCEDLAKSARDEVQKAIQSHAACTTDADCISTSFSAQCFDSCGRAMNKNGTTDVSAAKDRVNGAQCKQFAAQGCKSTIPPCVPDGPPTCKSNICQ